MVGILLDRVSPKWPIELFTRLEEVSPTVTTHQAFAPLNTYAAMVYLVNAQTIQHLNNTWRGNSKPTNVLSFPQEPAQNGDNSVGDVFLCYEQLVSEANAAEKPVYQHALHLLVHGLLHLLGYTHNVDADTNTMQAIEIDVLASLNIPNPY